MANVPSSTRRALWLGTVTLASPNTNYHIIDLVNAVLAVQTGNNSTIAPGAMRELLLQGYPGVDGAGANTNDILVGDAALSATNFGFSLPIGSSVPFRSASNNTQLAGLYARSAGTAQKLNVTIMGA